MLGHEGAGTVERIGPGVDTHAPGDTVVLTFDSCGTCDRCARGRPAYCRSFHKLNSSGLRRDGSVAMSDAAGSPVHGSFCGQSSFATHALASTRNAVKVATDTPLELLGPLGCSMQTGAGTVLNVLKPEPGQSIAVFGAGAVGLSAVMAARVAGCDPIIAIDPSPERRALAEELGATQVFDEGLPRKTKVDYAIDAVGHPDVIAAATRSLASPGTAATLGFRGSPNPVTIDQGHLIYGRTLTGVIEGDSDPHTFIPHLVALNRDGRFPFERLIRTYPLQEIETALMDREAVKPVLVV